MRTLSKMLIAIISLTLLFPSSVFATTGSYQRFEHGSIYSSSLGTFAVKDPLDTFYRGNGGVGRYGFPKEETTVKGDKQCQEFETGELCYQACPPGQVLDGSQCVEQKEYECRQQGLHKFISSQNKIVCAKVLDVPYINQYLKDNGSYSEPSDGWMMCGAASSAMVSAYYKKIPITNNSYRAKDYMYKNEGQGLIAGTQRKEIINPYTNTPAILCHDGIFGVTGAFVSCKLSSKEGIEQYLKYVKLVKRGDLWHNSKNNEPTWNFVKSSIDSGNPVIIAYGWATDSNFGHITVIKGYTSDVDGRMFVMNDSFADTSVHGITSYNMDGRDALYSLWNGLWQPGYLLSYGSN